MFERLALDFLGADRSFAVLTFIAVHNLFLEIVHRIDRDYEIASR
jgi:energy-converting hydrogenase Eha subunit E